MRILGDRGFASSFGGCAGRAPAPLVFFHHRPLHGLHGDSYQRDRPTTERVKQLAADKGLKTMQNGAEGVAGLFIPVLLFGMTSREPPKPKSRPQFRQRIWQCSPIKSAVAQSQIPTTGG